jgi:hypothetical protein
MRSLPDHHERDAARVPIEPLHQRERARRGPLAARLGVVVGVVVDLERLVGGRDGLRGEQATEDGEQAAKDGEHGEASEHLPCIGRSGRGLSGDPYP